MDFILEKISALRCRDLTGAKLVATFLRKRVQPLRLRRSPMWEYVGMADPDRCSSKELTSEEVRALLTAITEGASSASLSGGPRALNHSIRSELVRFFLGCPVVDSLVLPMPRLALF